MKRGIQVARKITEEPKGRAGPGYKVTNKYINNGFEIISSAIDSDQEYYEPSPRKIVQNPQRGRKIQEYKVKESPNSLYGDCESVKKCHSSTSVNSIKCIKNKMKVVVRVRAKQKKERGERFRTIVKRLNNNRLLFDPPEEITDFYFHGVKQPVRPDVGSKRPNRNLEFIFDAVFDNEHTNEEIFEVSLKPMINHIVDGFNCSVFAYGATGSGKTYTMLGSQTNPGLTVLMAEELYRRIGMMANEYEAEILVSYLEVYNETLKDLIEPSQSLQIVEDNCTGVRIRNLSQHKPSGPSALLSLLTSGNSARTQHSTDYNKESSRSHAVFQITVSMKEKFPPIHQKVKKATAKLVMVDLAGSERGGAAGFAGMRQREGANINKSLLALANCINALADGKSHIPYRDSKLTRLLKDSLSGNCLTVMVANISPTKMCFDDTYNTLRYADRAKNIKVTCKRNLVEEDYSAKGYKDQILDLTTRCQNNEKRYEELKRKYEELETQFSNNNEGRGDAPTRNDNEGVTTAFSRLVYSPHGKIRIVTPGRVISNKDALNTLVEYLHSQREKEENLIDESIKAKEGGWQTCWNRWKLEISNFLGKLCPSDPNFMILTRLRNEYYLKKENQGILDSNVIDAQKIVDAIKSDIEQLFNTSLAEQKLHEPFLTVTLQEFLDFISLRQEVSCLQKLKDHANSIYEVTFRELVNSETTKINCLDLMQHMYDFFKRQGVLSDEMKISYRKIMAQAYGSNLVLQIPKRNRYAGVLLSKKLDDLKKFAMCPVTDFPIKRDTSTEQVTEIQSKETSCEEYLNSTSASDNALKSESTGSLCTTVQSNDYAASNACYQMSSLISTKPQDNISGFPLVFTPIPEASLKSSSSEEKLNPNELKRSETAVIVNPNPDLDIARKYASIIAFQNSYISKIGESNYTPSKSKSELIPNSTNKVCVPQKTRSDSKCYPINNKVPAKQISKSTSKSNQSRQAPPIKAPPFNNRPLNIRHENSIQRNTPLKAPIANNNINNKLKSSSTNGKTPQAPISNKTAAGITDSKNITRKISPYLSSTPENKRFTSSNNTKLPAKVYPVKNKPYADTNNNKISATQTKSKLPVKRK